MLFGITAQGLETIHHKANDKVVLKRLEELVKQYEIQTIVIGMPYHMNGESKFNNIKLEEMDERLTTVAAHKTMNDLDVHKSKKRDIVDTISAVYILEMYMNKKKNQMKTI